VRRENEMNAEQVSDSDTRRQKAVGRPTVYSEELAEKILLRMCDGDSLRKICRDEDMPARSTVHLWRIKIATFSDQYARAREAQVEARIEEANDIADDGTNDYTETEGGARFNPENVQRSKLRCEQRRWEATKVLHKRYGDKLEVEGKVGIQRIIVREETEPVTRPPAPRPEFEDASD
jgi:hypothetical protein